MKLLWDFAYCQRLNTGESNNCYFGIVIGFGPLKGICPEFQVIRGFSQKIPADLLSYDQIHS